MATLPELLANLDANIQVRGHQFEHICKWYLENDPKYRLETKKVWLWKDWPGKWGPDHIIITRFSFTVTYNFQV